VPRAPRIRIDARSATPIYEQVMRQVRQAVSTGAAEVGAALPSVRALAVELRVNPNTVARAYRELEAEGVVETRRGQGTFVAGPGRRLSVAQRRRSLEPLLEQAVAEARALGFGRDELDRLVDETWARLSDESKGGRR
jgi:GntR family transcriptional regulator